MIDNFDELETIDGIDLTVCQGGAKRYKNDDDILHDCFFELRKMVNGRLAFKILSYRLTINADAEIIDPSWMMASFPFEIIPSFS